MESKCKNIITKSIGALLTLLVLSAFMPSWENAEAAEISYEPVFNQTEARSMLDYINDFRTGDDAWYLNSDNTTKTYCNNLQPLVYDYDLEKVAMQRAAEIAIAWGHTRPDGSSTWTAYDDCGYERWGAGENIAAGYGSAYSVYIGWREDDYDYSGQGHRRNMLSSGFKAIGIACVTVGGYKYWVQEFSSYVSSDQPTTANDSATPVKVKVTDSDMSLYSASDMTVSVDVGSSILIPSAEATVQFAKAWPSGKKISVKFPDVFNSADNNYVTISGNSIVGLKAGTGTVSGTLLGTTVSLTVNVIRIAIAYGDIDGDGIVTPYDVTILKRYLVDGWNVQINEEAADLNGDGEINSKDVTILRRYLSGGWGIVLPD